MEGTLGKCATLITHLQPMKSSFDHVVLQACTIRGCPTTIMIFVYQSILGDIWLWVGVLKASSTLGEPLPCPCGSVE